MKITLLGGGGFRTPEVWSALARLPDDMRLEELVLQDVDARHLARMSSVLEGLRQERGDGPHVRTTTSLIEAVEGSSAVFCAIRVGGLEGRVVDEVIPVQEGVLGQETVGPGGISFALRTVPVMLDIARAVAQRAPQAWFLNFTNPAGLVTEVVISELGDRAVGICDSPRALCGRVAAALNVAGASVTFDYAGLNHLGWLRAVRKGDHDLLPALLDDGPRLRLVDEARLFGTQRLRELQMIPNEYLIYYEAPQSILDAYRKAGGTRGQVLFRQQARFFEGRNESAAEALQGWRRARAARYGSYMSEAWENAQDSQSLWDDGEASEYGDSEGPGIAGGEDLPHGELEEEGYAGVAADLLYALTQNRGGFSILNVRNEGRLPGLDDDAVVEIPCEVSAGGIHPRAMRALPSAQADLVARVKEVERMTIRAAIEGSRALALAAIAAHPVVPSLEVAERILSRYMAAFPSLAEQLR
jgi:6-phospho-beta-glucosidase